MYLLEEFMAPIKVKTFSGKEKFIFILFNPPKSEVSKLEKELMGTEEDTFYGLRTLIIPYKVNKKQEKIVDTNNFDNVDVYVWDGIIFHDRIIEKIKNFGYKNKYGKNISLLNTFMGVKVEPKQPFEIGPIFKSYDKNATLDKKALEAAELAQQKTYNNFKVIG